MFKDMYFLPIVYLIPDKIAEKRGFADFPRDPYVAATDEKWLEIYHSKQFQVTLLDTWAWMMWQSLGIRGGIDNYSIRNPITRMVYDLGMWVWLLSEIGINTDMLAKYPHGKEIPYLTMEEAAVNCDSFANVFWNHPDLKMREVWEIVKTHRAHGDYSSMPSHAKIDFHRHYYHTRADTKVVPVTNSNDDNDDERTVYAPYTPSEFAEVETQMWFDEFLEQLNEKDQKIVKLLEQGYTQEEIGQMLGYANHSGVSKRVQYIRTAFLDFKKADVELLKWQHAEGKQKKRKQATP
jgi:DNA-binding NarL/FixJ family response regulator